MDLSERFVQRGQDYMAMSAEHKEDNEFTALTRCTIALTLLEIGKILHEAEREHDSMDSFGEAA